MARVTSFPGARVSNDDQAHIAPITAYRVHLFRTLHELDATATPTVAAAAAKDPAAVVNLMISVAEELARVSPELGVQTAVQLAAHIEGWPAGLRWLRDATAGATTVTITADAHARRSYVDSRNLISARFGL